MCEYSGMVDITKQAGCTVSCYIRIVVCLRCDLNDARISQNLNLETQ